MAFNRFLAVSVAALILSLAAIAWLPALGVARPDPDAAWAASLYVQKDRIANAVAGKRVLAVGGSGTLFSLDTVELSKHLGEPVVNFGTHAGLGLTYILYRAGQELRPGDVVLLAPEYELLQQSSRPNALLIQFVDFFDRAFIPTRPLIEQAQYWLGYGVLPSLTEGIKTIFLGPPKGRNDITLDRLGNARGNTVAAARAKHLVVDGPPPTPLPISPDAIAALRRFSAQARERHARIYVIPPTLVREAGYDAPPYQRFRRHVKAMFLGIGMTYLGDPEKTLLPTADMYDSIYHANDRGRAAYTAVILRAICGTLHCQKPE